MSARIVVHKKTGRVFALIKGFDQKMVSGLTQSLYFIGPRLVKEGQRLMALPKTGRFYKIKGKIHQASAPFEAPANLTGRMSSSLHSVPHGYSQLEFGVALKRGIAPYPMFLEDGTKKMRPRQLLLQTVNNKARDLQKVIELILAKEFSWL